MKCKGLLAGIALGFAAAYLLKDQLKSPFISSDKALQLVKKEFRKKGPIEGSWIYTVPEDYSIHDSNHKVYKTGITRTTEGALEQFEAIVHAQTGLLLEVNKVS
ncbi:PepSY domain-containing protein [Metabacillus sp. 84]|uniref:PepSY domain-containing protein n=1 Tax=unclassified Metabacillus TaxID=2675274 RepID=UPI003CF1FBB6